MADSSRFGSATGIQSEYAWEDEMNTESLPTYDEVAMADRGTDVPRLRTLGIDRDFISQKRQHIVVKRESLTLGDYSVNMGARTILTCSGEMMSASNRKHFINIRRQPMFTLRREVFASRATWYLETPAGVRFLNIIHDSSFGGMGFRIEFKNATEQNEDVVLLVAGTFFGFNVTISYKGAPIAKVVRSQGVFFSKRDSYDVIVAARVDIALIGAVIVALNEKERSSRRGRGGAGLAGMAAAGAGGGGG